MPADFSSQSNGSEGKKFCCKGLWPYDLIRKMVCPANSFSCPSRAVFQCPPCRLGTSCWWPATGPRILGGRDACRVTSCGKRSTINFLKSQKTLWFYSLRAHWFPSASPVRKNVFSERVVMQWNPSGFPGRWGCPRPWRHPRTMETWHLGT